MPTNTPSSVTASSVTASAVTLNNVSFAWPDGTPAFSALSGSFGSGRTGLVGSNGAGKSTLLKLIAGLLTPATGHIGAPADIGYLPQALTLDASVTVAGLLGIADKLAALHAIEHGDVAEEHFEVLGDDWDLETRAAEALRAIGLSAADLERRVAQLSGGEAMLVAITGLRLRRTAVTLLDEPSNNLDRAARARLLTLLRSWPGTLLVVSHDTALLECMQQTAELHAGELTVFGGPYSAWREHQGVQQAAAAQSVRTAEQRLKAEKRQRVVAETALARRARTAQKNYDNRTAAKIVMHQKASNAQVSAGKLRSGGDDRVQEAQGALDAAASRMRAEESIHLELPDPGVPAGRGIAELSSASGTTVYLRGPERVALVGANGVGKSMLLEALVNGHASLDLAAAADRAGGRLLTERVGYLSQRLDGLDDDASAIENVRAVASGASESVIRNRLARLLLRGDSVHRPVRTLSGGERFRVALARLLFAEPPAQLLVLDEPTNNLDLQTVDQLVGALRSYRGALLVVSHDDAFLGRLALDRVLELSSDGSVREIADGVAGLVG
ncbi:ABC-F family ATP-binding cassette domain-containing protein [Microterricola viridarii]|uniref:ABC transporter n=1 Tax=Microterricola viridarii TaxID=412690 RepID=A0A0X8E2Z4_9MICO|nr:ATP-binding cassette domain-containing protein [Microterricola viridarii]AMB58777.1 ABC transporter [Microterricola viridarii]